MTTPERVDSPLPKPDPSTERTEPPRVAVEGSATRCPYCHENVDVEREAWTVCAACLARHHEGCWNEHSCCASCSESTPLSVARKATRLGPLPERAAQALDISAAYAEAKSLFDAKHMPLFVAAGLSMLLASAGGPLVSGLTGAGVWSMCLSSLRTGERGRISDLFTHANKYVPLLIASVLSVVFLLFGFAFFVIGAAVVSGGLAYTLPLIVERDLGVKDAFKTSWKLARTGGLMKHALLAVLTLLPALVLMLPGLGIVGFAALTPLVAGVWAAAYRQVTGEHAGMGTRTQGKGKPDGKSDPEHEDEPANL